MSPTASFKLSSMKDVAKAAGVSVATVSRYLNRSLTLPASTAQRIEAAIAKLDYRRNPHARRLSLGRTDVIGLVVPDIANPFFATLAASVEEAADSFDLGVALCSSLNRPGRELKYLDQLRRNEVDGLIFVTNHNDRDGSLAREINLVSRVVVLDEDVPGVDVPKVFCDNVAAGRLAAEHFLGMGHRAIAFLGSATDMVSTKGRMGGLAAALRESGADGAINFTRHGDYTTEFGRAAAREFIEAGLPSSAIFAASDEIALGVLDAFRQAGVSVPDDVSMIGCDDTAPLHLLDPPLTAIRQPVRAMGRRGVELLMAGARPEGATSREELLPVELIERASVRPPTERVHQRMAALEKQRM